MNPLILRSPLEMFGLPAAAGATAYVTSVQHAAITIANGQTVGTATISSIDTTKTFLIYLGSNNDSNNGGNVTRARVTLTNATTVTATRNTLSAGQSVIVNVVIVECDSNLIDSVEYGSVSISASTTGTATISSVTTTRSVAIPLGFTTTSTSTSPADWHAAVTLTNSTTVTANVTNSVTDTVNFVVVQFKAAALQSNVQQVSDAYTSTSLTDTKTITGVTANNSMIVWGGHIQSQNNFVDSFYTATLTNGTTVTLTRGGTGAGSRTPYYTVVEFITGVFVSNPQRGTVAMNNVTSNTATISAVGSKAVCNFQGYSTTGSATNTSASINSRAILTNSTTVTGNKSVAGSILATVGYEVLDFN
jgi:hypothetical protein